MQRWDAPGTCSSVVSHMGERFLRAIAATSDRDKAHKSTKRGRENK
jgi:hypothetical protein